MCFANNAAKIVLQLALFYELLVPFGFHLTVAGIYIKHQDGALSGERNVSFLTNDWRPRINAEGNRSGACVSGTVCEDQR